MKTNKIDVNHIRDSYLDPNVVEEYGQDTINIGLWNSEKFIVEKYLTKSDRILDLGCGAGRTTIGLYKLGYKNIIGFDLSEMMIGKAIEISSREGCPIDFVMGNALCLKFDDSSFDAVLFSFNGLMLIPGKNNRIKALFEIRRVLKPGGIFIFTTHADRGKGIYESFWLEQNERWNKGLQDERLIDFGDILYEDEYGTHYLHIPIRDEVIQEITESGLKLIEDKLRSEICIESEAVLNKCAECRFWVVKK